MGKIKFPRPDQTTEAAGGCFYSIISGVLFRFRMNENCHFKVVKC